MSEDSIQVGLDEIAENGQNNRDTSRRHIRQLGIKSPEGWKEIRIGEIGELDTSSVNKKSDVEEKSVKLVNYMDVYENYVIDDKIDYMEVTAPDSQIERSQVVPGDILFTPSSEEPGDIGNSAVVTEEMERTLHSYHTVRLRPASNDIQLDIGFSGWLMNAPYVAKQFSRRATGSTRYTLTLNDFAETRVLVPPVSEQRKISSVLYTVDQAIQKNKEIREKAKSVEEVAKTEFFTQGYSEWEVQESVGWRCRANQFPKDWKVKTADELMEITRGASPRPRSDDSLFGGDIPWIKIGDANRDESKRIEEVDSYVTEKGKSKSKFVEEGTLLVANSGATCGFSIFAGVDGCVHDGWLVLRGYDDFSPDFLYHYINWNYDYLQSLSLGSAQTNLSTSLFGRLDIPIPPLQEQQQIVEALDSVGEIIALASTEIDRLQRLKQGLMQNLLSGEVRTHDKDIEVVDDVLQYG